jgi:NDP-hexose-3-ketoreductase
MRILFIGYSSVLKRRILPFIHEIKSLTSVDIAKYHTQKDELIEPFKTPGHVFNSYEEALEKSTADIAYISTVNSAHSFWAEKALTKGMHVIVDKPAFLDIGRTLDLVQLAEKQKLALAEANVYPFHSQINTIKMAMKAESLKPIHITADFSFPPLDPQNFRYKKDLGGGALNDLGPYAVSAGRIFFNESPRKLLCIVNEFDKINEVETSFSIMAQYSKGRSMTGHFGFNSEYINRINLFGENFYFEINNVFTPKSDLENEIVFRKQNISKILKAGKSNCFINFLQEYIDSIETGNSSLFSSLLIQDAKAIDQLKISALQNKL